MLNTIFFRYYTVPPEEPACQLSAEIVTQMAKEFDIDNLAEDEKMMLDGVEAEASADNPAPLEPLIVDSSGPVEAAMEVEIQKQAVIFLINILLNVNQRNSTCKDYSEDLN